MKSAEAPEIKRHEKAVPVKKTFDLSGRNEADAWPGKLEGGVAVLRVGSGEA